MNDSFRELQHAGMIENVRIMLNLIGPEDQPGTKGTPERVAKMWQELTAGYWQDPKKVFTVFDEPGKLQELIFVGNIPFTAICEHHLMPFTGNAHCAYIPKPVEKLVRNEKGAIQQTDGVLDSKWITRVAGLSKFARLVEVFARRLTIQERMTEQIALTIHEQLNPIGCGVVVEAQHGCISCRGVNKAGIRTVTSSLYGCFKEAQVRSEFFQFIK